MANPRAGALKRVEEGDVLLFWGLLCRDFGKGWDTFGVDGHDRGWYLMGAMRVAWIVKEHQGLDEVPKPYRAQAAANMHVRGRKRLYSRFLKQRWGTF